MSHSVRVSVLGLDSSRERHFTTYLSFQPLLDPVRLILLTHDRDFGFVRFHTHYEGSALREPLHIFRRRKEAGFFVQSGVEFTLEAIRVDNLNGCYAITARLGWVRGHDCFYQGPFRAAPRAPGITCGPSDVANDHVDEEPAHRSEERRVGKEC